MAQTPGDLVDRISILNLKIWHLQDWVYRAAAMEPHEFAAVPADQVQAKIKQLAELNLDRSRAVGEFDAALEAAIHAGRIGSPSRAKIT